MSTHSTTSSSTSSYATPLASSPLPDQNGSDILALLQTCTSMHDLQTRIPPFTLPSPPSLSVSTPARGSTRLDPLAILSTSPPSETALPSPLPMTDNAPAPAPAELVPPPTIMAIDPVELSARLARLLPGASMPFGYLSYLSSHSTHYSDSGTSTPSPRAPNPTRPYALATASVESFYDRNETLLNRLRHAEPTDAECIAALRDCLCRRLYVDYDPRFSRKSFSRSGFHPPTHCLTPTQPQGTYMRFLEDGESEDEVLGDGLKWQKRIWWLRYTEQLAVKAGICPKYARRQVERLREGTTVSRWSDSCLEFLPALEFASLPWRLAREGRWKECVERVLSDLENVKGVDGMDARAGIETFGSVEVWEAVRAWRRGTIEEWRDRFFERCAWRGFWVLGRRGRWMDERRRVRKLIGKVLGREEEPRLVWGSEETRSGLVVPAAGEMRRMVLIVGRAEKVQVECVREKRTLGEWARWLVRYPVVAVRRKRSRSSSERTDSANSMDATELVLPDVPARSTGWAGRIRTDRDEYPRAEHVDNGVVVQSATGT